MKKTCIIIAGPTAVGKTALAIELARHFSTEIISADSRQCYRELGIGVAKPSSEQLASVRHHFINSHSIHEEVSAATFEKYALQSVEEIFSGHDMAVMVGGTGLYIRAFCEGLDPVPPADESLRSRITDEYHEKGISWLAAQLQLLDPGYAANGEMQNPQRMMRALEVVMATGKSIVHFQRGNKLQRDFNIIKICLDLPRDLLYERINERVDGMMGSGLLEEAKALLPYRKLNALQTVGYRELFDYFDEAGNGFDEEKLAKAIELIKQHTRHYAKRQITWFRREAGMHACYPSFKSLMALLPGLS